MSAPSPNDEERRKVVARSKAIDSLRVLMLATLEGASETFDLLFEQFARAEIEQLGLEPRAFFQSVIDTLRLVRDRFPPTADAPPTADETAAVDATNRTMQTTAGTPYEMPHFANITFRHPPRRSSGETAVSAATVDVPTPLSTRTSRAASRLSERHGKPNINLLNLRNPALRQSTTSNRNRRSLRHVVRFDEPPTEANEATAAADGRAEEVDVKPHLEVLKRQLELAPTEPPAVRVEAPADVAEREANDVAEKKAEKAPSAPTASTEIEAAERAHVPLDVLEEPPAAPLAAAAASNAKKADGGETGRKKAVLADRNAQEAAEEEAAGVAAAEKSAVQTPAGKKRAPLPPPRRLLRPRAKTRSLLVCSALRKSTTKKAITKRGRPPAVQPAAAKERPPAKKKRGKADAPPAVRPEAVEPMES
ncbi:hypothetical protein M3Y99_00676400 [Aphelenchoides fujianensis]|nr:hypothetical protein M3Y99_00676400 [Aphelenchoides fujianensis]